MSEAAQPVGGKIEDESIDQYLVRLKRFGAQIAREAFASLDGTIKGRTEEFADIMSAVRDVVMARDHVLTNDEWMAVLEALPSEYTAA